MIEFQVLVVCDRCRNAEAHVALELDVGRFGALSTKNPEGLLPLRWVRGLGDEIICEDCAKEGKE